LTTPLRQGRVGVQAPRYAGIPVSFGVLREPHASGNSGMMQPSDSVRSKNMRAVRWRDTKPELFVRRELHRAGYRFRLHRRDLPGNPDIVLPRYRLAVFVHGCFWHGHTCSKGQQRPRNNADFWAHKLDGNIRRDHRNCAALCQLGWQVRVLWECSLVADCEAMLRELSEQIGSG
jgi:DNA mismatch endonuclease, patch repair protein